jgi:ATP-dependent RNA helicase DeaD
MSGFDEIGIDPVLIERLAELGYRRPTAFQREAAPVIARGTTAVGVASAGCGKSLALGLGLGARVDPEGPATQALILRPTDDRAAATAESTFRLVRDLGITVSFVRADATELAAGAHIVVASPAAALAAIRNAHLKLATVQTFVVDGLSANLELGGGEALETVTGQVPREAQRVILTGTETPEVADWIERHARRARKLAPPAQVEPLPDATVDFHAGPRAGWLPVLVTALDQAASRGVERSVVHCRREADAQELADRLAVRGFVLAAEPDDNGTHLVWGEEAENRPGDLSVSWGAPGDLPTLHHRTKDAARTLIMLPPTELPHLERLAGSLEIGLRPLRVTPAPDALASIRETRDRLLEAARERDLEPYGLLLDPLLEELTPAQLAAAAAALLRDRMPATPETRMPAWTRVYFGVGRKEGVRPADLVGAITGESSVSGDRLGRIEIRETHSLVEVAAEVADQVIRSMSGTSIRGRPANARVYRE